MAEEIGVAVVGLGRISRTHIDGIRLNPDTTRLAAVVDIDESLAKSTAETFNTKFYTSVEAALNDPDIQAIVVCLPHYLHKPIAIQSMEAGRHVLVEKPLATNLVAGEEMVRKAREKAVVLMSGQSFRFIAAYQEAKRRMRDEIGDPFNFIYTEACDFNITNAPPWWQDDEKTGGLAFSMLGSHTVDMTLWMYEGRKPVRVYAEARSVNRSFEGMDEIVVVISFDDGSIATNFLSLNSRPERFEGIILGPKGSMFLKMARTQVLGIFSSALFVNGELVYSSEQQPHNFALQIREFSEAILQKREPMVKNQEVLTQLAILGTAKKSAEIHQPVNL